MVIVVFRLKKPGFIKCIFMRFLLKKKKGTKNLNTE